VGSPRWTPFLHILGQINFILIVPLLMLVTDPGLFADATQKSWSPIVFLAENRPRYSWSRQSPVGCAFVVRFTTWADSVVSSFRPEWFGAGQARSHHGFMPGVGLCRSCVSRGSSG